MMDLRERHGGGSGVEYRHPWELSRTRSLLKVFEKYLDNVNADGGRRRYVNVGAGDLYFDKFLLQKYKNDYAYAVDLEYDKTVPDYSHISKFHYLEEVSGEMDYGIMMDSLEYMTDDLAYVRALSEQVKEDGYLFFTLPAIPSIFSEYDHIVKNLRRYDNKGFKNLIAQIPELEIVESHYFYTSLFLIRFLQVRLKLQIDKNRKVTSHWKYPEKNIITKCFVKILDLDFMINRAWSKIGIKLPGLSLLVVCKKVKDIKKLDVG